MQPFLSSPNSLSPAFICHPGKLKYFVLQVEKKITFFLKYTPVMQNFDKRNSLTLREFLAENTTPLYSAFHK